MLTNNGPQTKLGYDTQVQVFFPREQLRVLTDKVCTISMQYEL